MHRDERYKLAVYHGSDYGELYDLSRDPGEHENLWEDPGHRDVRCRMIKASFDATAMATDPGSIQDRTVLTDQYTHPPMTGAPYRTNRARVQRGSMGMEAAGMTETITAEYERLELEILRLKYVLAKVADSYNLAGANKASFRDRVVAAADELNAHMQAVANNRPTRYNIDEFEKTEGAYIRRLAEEIEALQSAGLKLLHSKVNFRRTAISESEVDEQLVTGRIFDAPTLGRDKLDHLGAVRRFLRPEPDPARRQGPGVERELQRLKLESYLKAIGKWTCENPDILFKTRAKIEAALSARGCSFVSAEEMQRGDLPNRGELYAAPTATGGFALRYCEGAVCLHLVLDLMRGSGKGLEFSGRVGGWAEAGAVRAEFSATHPHSGARVDSQGGPALVKELLDVTATAAIYQEVSARYEEWKRRDSVRSERSQKEARDKVSRALDELL